MSENIGRGRVPTTDMRARIAALRDQGIAADDIVKILWDRNYRAVVLGEGYRYEFAGEAADEVRPAR